MRKIIDYFICDSDNASELERMVLVKINKGWQPLGGVSHDTYGYTQAVVKYEDLSNLEEPF